MSKVQISQRRKENHFSSLYSWFHSFGQNQNLMSIGECWNGNRGVNRELPPPAQLHPEHEQRSWLWSKLHLSSYFILPSLVNNTRTVYFAKNSNTFGICFKSWLTWVWNVVCLHVICSFLNYDSFSFRVSYNNIIYYISCYIFLYCVDLLGFVVVSCTSLLSLQMQWRDRAQLWTITVISNSFKGGLIAHVFVGLLTTPGH